MRLLGNKCKIIRAFFTLMVLIPTMAIGQTRDEEVAERINYFKSNPIFVMQLTLDEKSIKKLGDKEIESAKYELELINRNIRKAFKTFWEISDTIIFVSDPELKSSKKEFKGAIFFEIVKLGEFTNDKEKVIPVLALKLSRPNRSDYFKNVVPRVGIDTSLVNTITEIRQLSLNVMTGEVVNKKELGRKVIVLNKEDQITKFGESYINLIRTKYTGSFIEVNNKFVLDILMRKDPKYIYVKNGSAYNAEDGSMIPLN